MTALACLLMACAAGVLAEGGELARVWPLVIVCAGCMMAAGALLDDDQGQA